MGRVPDAGDRLGGRPLPRELLKLVAAPVVALLAFVAEWLLFTLPALRGALGLFLSPLAFYAAGVVLCLAAYRHLQRHQPELDRPAPGDARGRWRVVLPWLVAGLAALITTIQMARVIAASPIDIRASDIIPALQVYVERLLTGEPVYRVIDFGYQFFPPYLPAHWVPFVVAEIGGLDYRWLAYGGFVIGSGFYVQRLAALRLPLVEEILKAGLPFAVAFSIMGAAANLFGQTVELLIVGYYYLLAAAIFNRGVVWRGIAIGLALLSRYVLAPWLPLFLGLVAYGEGRRRALLIVGLVTAAVVALYVVPFLAADWSIFVRGQEAYWAVALGEWQHFATPGVTHHVHNGLGFAVYVYELVPGDLAARINLSRLIHVVASLAIVALVALVYARSTPRIDHRLYALLTLKLSVATFYFFIQVPYAYLVSLSVLLSVFVLLFVSLPPPQGSHRPAWR